MSEGSRQALVADGSGASEAAIAGTLACSGSGPQHGLAVAEMSETQSAGARFNFEAQGLGKHSPLYQNTPVRSTVAVNAGDYRLYVGGHAINGAFAELLHEEQGTDYDMENFNRWELVHYTQLHRELLTASRNSGGTFVASPSIPAVETHVRNLQQSIVCAMAGEASDQDTPGHEAASGAVFLHIFLQTRGLWRRRMWQCCTRWG